MTDQLMHVKINENNIVTAVAYLNRDESKNGYIIIRNGIGVDLGYVYDPTSQTFTPPEPLPEPEPTPTIEQRLEAIEMTSAHTQIQVDYVAFLTEILAMPK